MAGKVFFPILDSPRRALTSLPAIDHPRQTTFRFHLATFTLFLPPSAPRVPMPEFCPADFVS